ncbi:MAG: amino acid adenylation domain-containing protein, partial [Gammaproteobacteria bacterium]|nr:amino acid adenylation domain-containing protein [Gammaproteobacteria bacterium]
MPDMQSQIDGLSSTKRQLLEALAQRHRAQRDAPAPAVGGAPGQTRPVSYGQRRLWFLNRLEPGSPLYNLPAAIRLEGPLDARALRAALREVVRRHEILRTAFHDEDGEPVQIAVARPTLPCSTVDLRPLRPRHADHALARVLATEPRRPFALDAPPLLRVTLIRLGADHHVLLITMHHIVSDGWSVGVLIREAVTLYSAYVAGRPSPLPDLPLQYADFAAWQRERLRGERLRPQLEHFTAELGGAGAPLDLPTDRPRLAARDRLGATVRFSLPAKLVERLRAFARSHDATLFMTLLAAFETLLHRYTGRTDFNVGVPIAGRHTPGVGALLGFFVNFLVLRSDVGGAPSFAELLARVRRRTLEAYRNQDVPFEVLVRELKPAREPDGMPFFNVIFDLNNTPSESLQLPGLRATPLDVDTGTTHADWVVNLFDDGRDVTGRFTYRADLFDEASIRRTIERFLVLLDGAAAEPDRPITRLPLLPPDERDRLMRWGSRQRAFDPRACVHERFEAAARRAPDRIAVSCEDRHLSYAELDRRANQLARELAVLGAGPGRLVGILLERSIETVVAILGVLKSGAGYVPMDPAYPADRLRFMLDDAGVCILLTQSAGKGAEPVTAEKSPATNRSAEKASAEESPAEGFTRMGRAETGTDPVSAEKGPDPFSASVLRLDRDWPRIGRHDGRRPGVDVHPDALAYVIYTSGSTGTPKGVGVTHRNVARLFDAAGELFDFGPDDTWTLFHSIAFDFSVWEIWGALGHGGRLLVVPFLTSRSPQRFLDLLGREQVSVLNQTPSAFRQLVLADDERGGTDATALRYVVFGGEALDVGALEPWLRRRGDERPRLVNMYGITETTVHVTYRRITSPDLDRPATSRIGRPLPDLELRILDPEGQPAPIGIPGEIHVGGDGVARGYHGRPALTAERFVPAPPEDSAARGERLYRSGDGARYLPDGDIEYLGRLDGQVKIRGFRIETGEIEAALEAAPTVREALVVAGRDAAGEQRLVAYVVAAPGARPDAAQLRRRLRERLPEHMVPAAFVALERIPMTPNGKIDRNALPEPERADAAPAGADEDTAAPATATEQRLAAIWEETLGRRRIGLHDDFFDLGGHSLLATRVVSRVRRVFDVEFPLGSLFRRPTIAQMAAEIDALVPEQRATEPPLAATGRTGRIPLAFPQQRLWFLEQLEPGNPAYVIPAAVRLRGRLRPLALFRAFDDVLRRHDALRTAFPAVGGRPEQRVHGFTPARVP